MERNEDSPLNSNKAIKSARIVATARALGFYDKDAQNPDYMAKYFLSLKFKIFLWYLRSVQKIIGSGFLERPAPGFYWYFQVRTKHIDSILMKSINAGIEQFVILGAGYDSRPYRFKEKLTGIRIFEVDFPGTLSSKKQQLIKLYGSLPEHVTYVPIDFNSQLIKDVLLEKGYDSNKKTFFIDDGMLDQALSHYRKRFSETGMFENIVYPEVASSLREIKGLGFHIFLATAKPKVFAKQILDHFNLSQFFHAIYESELNGRFSDKGELIDHILKSENLNPKMSLMVGDRVYDISVEKRMG